MSKKNIIMAIIAFVVGFSITFYVVRTYFPKHKIEETTNLKQIVAIMNNLLNLNLCNY